MCQYVKVSNYIKILALFICGGFLLVACGMEKQFLRYHDVQRPLKGEVILQARLVGTSYTEGAVAVGAPYRLFLSLYPAVEDIESLSIELLTVDGDLLESFEAELLREKAYEKEGEFLFFEKKSLKLNYDDYVLVIDSHGGLGENPIRLKFIRNKTLRKESDWWTRARSI